MKQQKGEENISFVCFLNLQDFLNMMKNNVYFLTFILLIKTDKYQLILYFYKNRKSFFRDH